MSGIFQRLSMIFRSKADKALDKVEDPRETLDYSYQKQLDLLQKVRRGVADVATSRKRVELQAQQLNLEAEKYQKAAKTALSQGREDLAREALSRRAGLEQQIADLQTQHSQLQAEEEKLTQASKQLQTKVNAFRTQKETIKAKYSAAEAQTRINEAFSGISEEMGDVGHAIQRAEDKTQQMQARAGAIDELLASGALDDPSMQTKDDITLELERMASGAAVDDELSRMKAELGQGPASKPELTGGNGAESTAEPSGPIARPVDPESSEFQQYPPTSGNGENTEGGTR
ncbi:PspA/IM30 family protein [Propionibacteriaceae bacterium Y2011]|uniref:PspA/IM30 family protein n=1 Tax=Microlunatus sp. Y2014 TaxID=3418488 RepID=UPI003B485A91